LTKQKNTITIKYTQRNQEIGKERKKDRKTSVFLIWKYVMYLKVLCEKRNINVLEIMTRIEEIKEDGFVLLNDINLPTVVIAQFVK
jgi:hypothetical protein